MQESRVSKNEKTEDRTVEKLNLQEKVALCSGADFWHTKAMPEYGIPAMMVADGPHGLRKQEDTTDMLGINRSVPATCFPTAVTTACSWDTELLAEIGEAIAEEAKANGVGVVLGPGANLKRNPLCGRNFEYFSEDPYLTGKLAAAYIRGAEGTGVGTSLKHFALNNQEYKRFSSDSIVDERTMRELYLKGFEIAVKEGKPSTVMCSYNKINGVHASDHKELLTDILREEWGFDGLVVTDWGAMSDRIKGFRAGCDLVMPGGSAYMERECVQAVKDGMLNESDVDQSVRRIINLVQKTQRALSEIEYKQTALLEKHYNLARRAASESAVLLKNKENILPLKESERIVFAGYMAEELRYQGAGSSHINPWKLTSVLDACKKQGIHGITYVQGCDKEGNTTRAMLQKVHDAAEKADKVVIFAGLPDSYESEGFDRDHMKMPKGHLQMIKAAVTANPNTAVVLLCGSAVEVPWLNHVKGLLYPGLSGEAGGDAIVDLLYGKVNPCGKLAESWPRKYEDCVCSDYYIRRMENSEKEIKSLNGKKYRKKNTMEDGWKDAQYREGLYVGYRYYETAEVPVRFPFGYGLSYTSFTFSDLQLEGKMVTCWVTNTGTRAGKEIVQLYVEPERKIPIDENTVYPYRPVRELKAFARVELEAGESKCVSFALDDESFSVWDQGWKIIPGNYQICIGTDAHNMILKVPIRVGQVTEMDTAPETENSEAYAPQTKVPAWYYQPYGTPSQEDFEALLGRKITEAKPHKGEYTMENTVMEMKEDSLIMKVLYKSIELFMARGFGGKIDYSNPTYRMMVRMAADCSLSGMKINAGMNNYLIEGLLEIVNGHLWKGLRTMLTGSRKILHKK